MTLSKQLQERKTTQEINALHASIYQISDEHEVTRHAIIDNKDAYRDQLAQRKQALLAGKPGTHNQPQAFKVVDGQDKYERQQVFEFEVSAFRNPQSTKLDFPHAPSIYRRDQTFVSKPGKTTEKVFEAVEAVLRTYNKANGYKNFKAGSDEQVKERFEWHEDSGNQNQRDKYRGKFPFTFCDGPLCCQGAISLYKTKTEESWMEVTFSNGERNTYYKIFDILTRALMGNSGPKNDVLDGLVCKDFYPVSPYAEDEYDYSEDEDDEDDLDDEEKEEVKEIIQERMDLWRETRFYEQKKDGLTELIELLDAYRPLFEECYIKDRGAKFEKAWCKALKRESDVAMARSMLLFMEKLVNGSTKNLRQCMNGQANGVYSHVFSCWSSWRQGGRFAPSWTMEDQILRTLKAMNCVGLCKSLGGGMVLPSNYMRAQIETLGIWYVLSFPDQLDIAEIIGQEFSEDFQDELRVRRQELEGADVQVLPEPADMQQAQIVKNDVQTTNDLQPLVTS